MARKKRTAKPAVSNGVEDYKHPEATGSRVPDAGAQPFLKSQHASGQYRYDSSLSPSLEWDERNPAREAAEVQIREILEAADLGAAKAAAAKLKAMSAPFLNWAGKSERPEIEVPTLPLFVHERLSTKGIIETLKGHRRSKQTTILDLFNDPQLSFGEQATRAYEHGPWSNRMILGDNLQVMNWLLRGENLGEQVQMIYLDPPYGIKYGSNFQPFVRDRNVAHNEDDDLTREPEMVQAYRDTWTLGPHTYLTYLRDRMALCRELLHPSGSIFVQLNDEHLHHAREMMDEVFGSENYINTICFARGGSQTSGTGVPVNCDYLLWYAKQHTSMRQYPVLIADGGWAVRSDDLWQELPDGKRERIRSLAQLSPDARPFTHNKLESARSTGSQLNKFMVEFEGQQFHPKRGWSTTPEGFERLKVQRRLLALGKSLRYVVYLDDFPFSTVTSYWSDTYESGFSAEKLYVVQTPRRVIERCMHMTTLPGDLVLDPTCGSGTTAYVSEQWGRRWITIDVSRVPLALARQRLLTATFNWYQLQEEGRGPAGGFVYKQKQNRKGEEIGGIVPHVTLRSIANGEPPAEEVLVDRPEINDKIIRVTGPFTYEASIPKALDDSAQPVAASEGFAARLLDALRRSPRLHFEGNQTVEVKNVRPPAKTLHLSAEGEILNGQASRVAFLFGPENGPVTEKQVVNAAREASMKGYDRLLVIGLNIQPGARLTIENAANMGIAATYLQATPDLLMGDLLKNMKSSQVFSVCGLPEVAVRRATPKESNGNGKTKGNGKKHTASGPELWQAELIGLDVFDPVTMEAIHRGGNDVPAWFLDTDYNDKCFHVCQAFFPRTAAWDNLKKELKAGYDEGVWDHLAGTTSAPFEPGEHRQVAVKVIDDRGNELMVVKPINGGK